jgi:hypothetical protein
MLFGFLFTRDASKITARTVRHESIHARQWIEVNILVSLLAITLCVFAGLSWWWLPLTLPAGFYLWYGVEWVIRLFGRGNAYRNISFEREAYANQDDILYLDTRRPFYFLKYMKK